MRLWPMAWGTLALLLVCPAAVAEPDADQSGSARFGAGASIGVGWFTWESVGPLLELRAVVQFGLSENLYIELMPVLLYTRHTHDKTLQYHESSAEELNTDERSIVALTGRALAGLRFAEFAAWELSGFVGPAWASVESTQCGKHSLDGIAYGFGTGPAFGFGEHKHVQVGLHAQALYVPYEVCVNSGSDPADFRFRPVLRTEDDWSVSLALSTHYLF